MLFADNGGGEFDREFRKLIKRVLQEYDLFIIPYDDEIFQRPSLLNGAPPLWHHSGRDALGIRHNGRLVVFYHQGDLGDAWKDDHGGTPAASWQAAYNLGVNVIDYAFRHYQEWLSRQK